MTAEPILAFEELAYFLASIAPKKVLAFKPSKQSQERVNHLLSKNAEQRLSAEENREMEKYMLIEHIVQLAKAKALLRIVKQ